MATEVTTLRVFIASPGGLEKERRAFRDTLEEFNRSDALPRGLQFLPIGWEDTLQTHGRPQALINKDLEKSDYCIFVLWNRWGSYPGRTRQQYTSGTEEEFDIANKAFKKGDSLKQIVLMFKGLSVAQLADPGVQLKRVLRFRRKIEKEKQHIFAHFDEVIDFERIVRRYLAKWTLDYERKQADVPSNTQSALPEATPETKNPTATELKLARQVAESSNAITLTNYGVFLAEVGRLTLAQFVLNWASQSARSRPSSHDAQQEDALRQAAQEALYKATSKRRIVFGGESLHVQKYLIPWSFYHGDELNEYGFLGRSLAEEGLVGLAFEIQSRRLARARSSGNPYFIAECLTDLTVTSTIGSNLLAAESYARQAVALDLPQRSDRSGVAFALGLYDLPEEESYVSQSKDEVTAILAHNLALTLADGRNWKHGIDLLESARAYWGDRFGQGFAVLRPPATEGTAAAHLNGWCQGWTGDDLWAASHAGIGLIHLYNGEWALAEKFHLEAELRTGLGGRVMQGIDNNMGVILHSVGRLNEAVLRYERSFRSSPHGLARKARVLTNLTVARRSDVDPYLLFSPEELSELVNRYATLGDGREPRL